MKKKILLLDIDYTVIHTDSMREFFIYAIIKKPAKLILNLPYVFSVLIMYILRLTSIERSKEAIYYAIKYFEEDELNEFFERKLIPKINTCMKKLILDYKKDGNPVIMITASPYAYMKYFESYDMADKVIGTELECIGSKYKNKISGKNCKKREKVKRLNEYLEKESFEIDYENSYAFSDSKSDLDMLSLVKNAYYVNKSDGEIKEKVN
ncbi:HAD family hydrolase [Metaclostridioides mangenotii]|uniref:HAD family hydrolase n=1 Tax=Metaclostridioides mangenotii TaxID=1540 RepID=UPI0028E48495|nr:HAD family hydrolase [Clostridioides mangenotii]